MRRLSYLPKYLVHLPVSRKISLSFSLLIVAIAVAIYLYFPNRRVETAISGAIDRAKSTAEIFSYVVAPTLQFNDIKTLEEDITRFNQLKELRYLVIFDKNDSLRAALNFSTALHSDFINTKKTADFSILTVKYAYPITLKGERLGTLYLGLSLAEVKSEIDNIKASIAAFSIIILVMGMGLIWGISRTILRPISEIAHTAKIIAQGDLSHRAPLYYDDEVGDLAKTFNSMVSNLQDAYHDLEELNVSLEHRVSERTKVLQAEVIEHKRTTDALRKSQQELLQQQKIFMGGPTVVYRLKADLERSFEYVSSSINQFGFSRQELTTNQTSFFNIVHPDDVFRLSQELNIISMSDASHFEMSFRLQRKDGDIRYVYSFITLARTPQGALTHFDGYLLDITSSRKVERALLESELRFKTIFSKAGIGIVITDLTGKIIEANPAFLNMLGYSLGELEQQSLQDITYQEDKLSDVFPEQLTSGDDPGTPVQHEQRYVHKAGWLIWTRITTSIIQNEANVPVFGLGLVEDITETKHTQQIVYQQNRTLNSVAETLRMLLTTPEFNAALKHTMSTLGTGIDVDRIYILEKDNYLPDSLSYSLKFEWLKTPDLTTARGVPKGSIDLFEKFPDWQHQLLSGHPVVIFGKAIPEEERDILNMEIYSSLFLVPIFVYDSLWGVLGFEDHQSMREWTDSEISILSMTAASIGGYIERQREELELFIAKEKAQESDKLKTTLLSNMSHEFRTPLNGILGYAELLTDNLTNLIDRNMARSITRSGQRLMQTLDSILDLSQLESNKLIPIIKKVHLASFIETQLPRYISTAEEKGLSLTWRINNDKLWAETDENMLGRVFNHLINNAIKFTQQGGVTIELSYDTNNPASLACISVKDTGIGLSPEHQQVIFDDFRQVSEGINRSYEGNGLGLAVSRRMIDLLQGEITLTSVLHQGSIFTISFPAYISDEIAATYSGQKSIYVNQSPAGGQKLHVLIVEDNDINSQVTALFLENLYFTDIAYTGLEAYEKAQVSQYDIILMDINLGVGIDGIEATKLIRSLENYHSTPIVALTGYSMSGDREKFLENGMTHYLSKPFERQTLLNLLQQIKTEYNYISSVL
ncbi:MAG: PAS domain S-box protein [Ignavibacteria bacterium]|nr:PAS domain S-box protein [Ignavibacteria bacterium]